MTDRERIYTELLAVRCKRGDKTAFAELVGQWERRLYYHIRRLVDSEEEASDILQETWMKALNGIRSLADTSRFPAWMYGIARHTRSVIFAGKYPSAAESRAGATMRTSPVTMVAGASRTLKRYIALLINFRCCRKKS